MARELFHTELAELTNQVLLLGSMTEKAIVAAVQSLRNGDRELSEKVVAEDAEGVVQGLELGGVEVGGLLERGELRLPEDLVHPGAADPGDHALVAQQGVQVAGGVERRSELRERGGRPRLGSERRDHVVGGDVGVVE